MSDMDKATLVLLAFAILCVIALLVIGAVSPVALITEPEPLIALSAQIAGGAYGRS